MVETVLAGPNGQPAIDQATQQPLTMEEMLRRRGLLAVGGNSRMMPLGAPAITASAPVDPSTSNATGLQAALAARAGANSSSDGDGPDNEASSTDAAQDASAAPIASTPNPTSAGIPFNPLGALAGGAGVVGGYALTKALLNRRKAKPTINSPEFGDSAPAPKPGLPAGTNKTTTPASVKANAREPMPTMAEPKKVGRTIPVGDYSEVPSLSSAIVQKLLGKVVP